jgi:hypothetical protein
MGEFAVQAGEAVPFVLSYASSSQNPPRAIDPVEALAHTEEAWRQWSGRCAHVGPWSEIVKRSLITFEGFDLRANRLNCCRRHHFAARTSRRRAKLGLPLLLAARRDVHAAGLHARRLLR